MKYKEIDFEGEETLKSMSHADKLNEWMYMQIKPFVKGKVLEVGSGIGNISQYFIRDNLDIELSDIRDQYLKFLECRFDSNKVHKLDLVNPNFEKEYSHLIGQFSLVFALNVIEHIENDKLALENIQKLLKPKGISYILVPAFNSLYNNFDKSLFHFRRYTKKKLENILPNNSKKIKSWYFNFAGIFGWVIVGGILKKRIIPESNIKLYNFLTPLFKVLDLVVMNKVGLSVIVVSEKKD